MSTLSTVPDLGLPHVHRGKVRDLYAVGEDRLLMVASDRLSAFDVVMAEPVPDKGRVLTAMSAHWFAEIDDVIGNHLISTDVADLPVEVRRDDLAGRIMLCRRAEMLPVECIVRGFVAGSAWKEYRDRGTIHGMAAPAGLVEADRLPEPIFTPSTKAAVGDHDGDRCHVRQRPHQRGEARIDVADFVERRDGNQDTGRVDGQPLTSL